MGMSRLPQMKPRHVLIGVGICACVALASKRPPTGPRPKILLMRKQKPIDEKEKSIEDILIPGYWNTTEGRWM